MTGAAVRVRIDTQFFGPSLTVIRVVTFEIQLRYKFWIANVRGRISVAVETPFHGKGLDLRDHFHFVDAAVTRHATDSAINMSRVIEVHKIWQVVNAIPQNRVVRF